MDPSFNQFTFLIPMSAGSQSTHCGVKIRIVHVESYMSITGLTIYFRICSVFECFDSMVQVKGSEVEDLKRVKGVVRPEQKMFIIRHLFLIVITLYQV